MMFLKPVQSKSCEQCGHDIKRFDLQHCRRFYSAYFCSQSCRTAYVRKYMRQLGYTMNELVRAKRRGKLT